MPPLAISYALSVAGQGDTSTSLFGLSTLDIMALGNVEVVLCG
jgi:hypothetical protein